MMGATPCEKRLAAISCNGQPMAQVVDAHPTGQHAWQSVKKFPGLHPLHLDDVPEF
jgi:N-glycosylase/DNA lyase